jgi:hypothetical protein
MSIVVTGIEFMEIIEMEVVGMELIDRKVISLAILNTKHLFIKSAQKKLSLFLLDSQQL